MLDVIPKISNLLEGIAHVELADSEAPLVMPSIYITQSTSSADVRMDNKDFLTGFIIQLDVYAETPGRCAEIAQVVDDVMQGEGWQRQNGFPMGRQRYMLTYQADVSENYDIYEKE